MNLSLPLGRLTASLDVANLLGVRGNSLAFGNPLGVADGKQITPLRPRTFRIGARYAF